MNCKQINPECKIYLNSVTSKDKKIVIGIGGSGKNKKWPINNFVNLILSLKKKNIRVINILLQEVKKKAMSQMRFIKLQAPVLYLYVK